jgi:hypothetical protein
VNDAAVTVDGTAVGVDLAELAPASYYVEIDAGALTDTSGNPFAGISGRSAWGFTASASARSISTSILDEEGDIVNTGGALVSAANFGESAVVVNGLTHGAGSAAGTNLAHNFFFEGDFRNGASGLPPGSIMDRLLSGIAGANPIEMSIGGLSVGRNYLFQAYWEANATGGQSLDITMEGVDNLGSVPARAPAVLISYEFTAGDDTLNVAIDRDDGLGGDQNNWLSGYSLQEIGVPFSGWIAGFPGVGNQDGFTDDPDHDRLANGLEAWFGTHPGEPGAGITGLATDGTITTFTHPLNAEPPTDVTGSYQWSPDLADWYAGGSGPAGGPTVSFTTTNAGPTTTVTATASEPLDSYFLRIEVRAE